MYIYIYIYIYCIYILDSYFFPSCFYLTIVTGRNSQSVANIFQVNDEEARLS